MMEDEMHSGISLRFQAIATFYFYFFSPDCKRNAHAYVLWSLNLV